MNYKTRKLVITLSIICILLFAFLTLTIILALSSCKSAAETSIAVSETEATAETIQETEPEITEAPTEESILENREHFLLGSASIGGNWTSLGLIRGLSRYYGNFFIGSDSTRYQTPLENLAEGLKRVAEPTLVWCIDGTMEGDHTRVTWNYLKDLSFDFAEVRHITILEGHHLYSTWLTALNYIMTNAF